MRIFLTGFMGAGKSTVGRLLAERLGLPFADLDTAIENRLGLTVREIFEQRGEVAFRRLEYDTLRAFCERPELVVATGGGTITVEASRELIERSGVSVWLHPSFATIVERIASGGKANRPLFRDETAAWKLYRSRLPTYRLCDFTVSVEAEEAPAEVAARIALMVRRGTTKCGI